MAEPAILIVYWAIGSLYVLLLAVVIYGLLVLLASVPQTSIPETLRQIGEFFLFIFG